MPHMMASMPFWLKLVCSIPPGLPDCFRRFGRWGKRAAAGSRRSRRFYSKDKLRSLA
jgi:hypothetical protein